MKILAWNNWEKLKHKHAGIEIPTLSENAQNTNFSKKKKLAESIFFWLCTIKFETQKYDKYFSVRACLILTKQISCR